MLIAEILFVAVVAVVFLYILFKFMKKLIYNTVVGLIILGVLYLLGVTFTIPLYITIIITVICGVPGIAALLILHFINVI